MRSTFQRFHRWQLRTVLALMALAIAFSHYSANASTAPQECDALAADPFDFERVGPAVCPYDLDVERALAACSAAVEQHPDEPRYLFQLGATQIAARQLEEGKVNLERAAVSGYLADAFRLALVLRDGRAENHRKKFEWLLEAAEAGHIYAQTGLADAYGRGEGVEADAEQERLWLERATENGELFSQLNLAKILVREAKSNDEKRAGLELAIDAAKKGYGDAAAFVGSVFMEGDIGEPNFEKARYWYSQAAKQAQSAATSLLADMYLRGQGGEQDTEQALALYETAAELGNTGAQVSLGVLYRDGRLIGNPPEGIKRDPILSYKWSKLAAENGDSAGQENLWVLERDLTDQEKAEGSRKVEQFVPQPRQPMWWFKEACSR